MPERGQRPGGRPARQTSLLYLSARGRKLHGRAARRVQAEQTRLLDAVNDEGALARVLLLLTAALDGRPPVTSAQDVARTPSA